MSRSHRVPRVGTHCGILLCLAAAGASAITLGFAWITVHATSIALTEISSGGAAMHDPLDVSTAHAPGTAELSQPIAEKTRKYVAGLPFVK